MQDQSQPLVVLMEDDLIHTTESPFCSLDPTCFCHVDPLLLAEVTHQIEEGLLTSDEATRVVMGLQL